MEKEERGQASEDKEQMGARDIRGGAKEERRDVGGHEDGRHQEC